MRADISSACRPSSLREVLTTLIQTSLLKNTKIVKIQPERIGFYSVKQDLHSAGINTIIVAQMVPSRSMRKAVLNGPPSLESEITRRAPSVSIR